MRRGFAKQAVEKHELSERRACRLVRLYRSSYRYQARPREDSAVIEILQRLAETHRRWGFDKMMDWLRTHGYRWNHKRVRRVYREMGLHLRIKPKENGCHLVSRCHWRNRKDRTSAGPWIS